MSDLEVLPIIDPPELDTSYPCNPVLPNARKGRGASVIHVGPPQSGKSTLLSNMLFRFYVDDQGESIFDEVYIFSSTILLGDSSTRHLRQKYEATIFTDPMTAEEDLYRILEFQSSFPVDPVTGESERPHIAIIFDDVISWIGAPLKKTSILFSIASSYRHYGIGLCMWLTQRYRALPPIVRSTVGYALIHAISSTKEQEALSDELWQRFPGEKKGFCDALAKATSDSKYHFLYLKLLDPKPAWYKNLTTLGWEGSDSAGQVVYRGGPPSTWDDD